MSKEKYEALARKVAEERGLNPEEFVRLIEMESAWNPQAVSPVGAQGIAQFLPSTAKEYGIDPFNPDQAIPAAADYLVKARQAYDEWQEQGIDPTRFDRDDLAYSIYNFGRQNTADFVQGKQDLPEETANYIEKIRGRPMQVLDAAGLPIESPGAPTTPTGAPAPPLEVGEASTIQPPNRTDVLYEEAQKLFPEKELEDLIDPRLLGALRLQAEGEGEPDDIFEVITAVGELIANPEKYAADQAQAREMQQAAMNSLLNLSQYGAQVNQAISQQRSGYVRDRMREEAIARRQINLELIESLPAEYGIDRTIFARELQKFGGDASQMTSAQILEAAAEAEKESRRRHLLSEDRTQFRKAFKEMDIPFSAENVEANMEMLLGAGFTEEQARLAAPAVTAEARREVRVFENAQAELRQSIEESQARVSDILAQQGFEAERIQQTWAKIAQGGQRIGLEERRVDLEGRRVSVAEEGLGLEAERLDLAREELGLKKAGFEFRKKIERRAADRADALAASLGTLRESQTRLNSARQAAVARGDKEGADKLAAHGIKLDIRAQREIRQGRQAAQEEARRILDSLQEIDTILYNLEANSADYDRKLEELKYEEEEGIRVRLRESAEETKRSLSEYRKELRSAYETANSLLESYKAQEISIIGDTVTKVDYFLEEASSYTAANPDLFIAAEDANALAELSPDLLINDPNKGPILNVELFFQVTANRPYDTLSSLEKRALNSLYNGMFTRVRRRLGADLTPDVFRAVQESLDVRYGGGMVENVYEAPDTAPILARQLGVTPYETPPNERTPDPAEAEPESPAAGAGIGPAAAADSPSISPQ